MIHYAIDNEEVVENIYLEERVNYERKFLLVRDFVAQKKHKEL